MPRLVATAVLALLWTAVAAAGDATPRRAIDLNAPGALEALQRSNPTHYEKVRKILEGVLQRPDTDVPRWIQTNFAAHDVSYVPVVLTSHPPQRRLTFALDARRYDAGTLHATVRGDITPER